MNRGILFLILLILVPVGCEETEDAVDAKRQVILFVNEMNPELYQAMVTMNEEMALAEKKIIQLSDLKELYPDQRHMINKSLDQWRKLLKDLKLTFNTISNQVEGAYVAYKIDEIQGRSKFNIISKALLKDANAVLAEAEVTKSTIERELYEK